jgi:GT2 family glycosyltransferase
LACAIPPVSVIVPTYRRERVLCDTLSHLLAQDYPDFEVVVVDQTPDHEPETRRFLEAHSSQLRHHTLPEPSLPRARNVGAKMARGEVVLFVDDDIIPLDDHLIAAHAACYVNPLVGAVAGRVLEPILPNAPEGIAHVNAFGRIVSNFLGVTPAEVGTAKGANMSFRHRVLAEVGPFDDRYAGNSILEETDYCYRVRALGYDIRFEPEAAVHHLVAPTGGCRESRWLDAKYWLFRNSALFYMKQKPRIGLPLFLGFFAARGALYVARAHGRPRDWVRLMRGLGEGFRAFGRGERSGAGGQPPVLPEEASAGESE